MRRVDVPPPEADRVQRRAQRNGETSPTAHCDWDCPVVLCMCRRPSSATPTSPVRRLRLVDGWLHGVSSLLSLFLASEMLFLSLLTELIYFFMSVSVKPELSNMPSFFSSNYRMPPCSLSTVLLAIDESMKKLTAS